MLGYQQRLVSFVFPKTSQKRMVGLIWSNDEKIKMVLSSANPLNCAVRSIFSWNILQTSWSQTKFTPLDQLYLSLKAFETISKEDSKGSRLHWATRCCGTGLIWDWWQYSTWWFTSRFWKSKGRSDNAYQTNDFYNTQEFALKRLKHSIKELKESHKSCWILKWII